MGKKQTGAWFYWLRPSGMWDYSSTGARAGRIYRPKDSGPYNRRHVVRVVLGKTKDHPWPSQLNVFRDTEEILGGDVYSYVHRVVDFQAVRCRKLLCKSKAEQLLFMNDSRQLLLVPEVARALRRMDKRPINFIALANYYDTEHSDYDRGLFSLIMSRYADFTPI